MNPLVQLVNEWDTYTQKHSTATIEDFCRFYLVKDHSDHLNTKVSCPEDHSKLLRSIGMLIASFNIYFKSAMSKSQFPFPESFYFLNILKQQGSMKKTGLINMLFMEYSTGMEGIRKLIEAGYIKEEADEHDKRAKTISITEAGEKILPQGYAYMGKIGSMMFGTMADDSLKLCLQLLEDAVEHNMTLSSQFKNADFDEMYQKSSVQLENTISDV